MTRRDLWVLGAAGGFAVLMPALLLMPREATVAAVQSAASVPLTAKPAAPLAVAYERALFGAATEAEAVPPQDAPELVGIVGRLGADAVALVRTSEGSTRTLAVGESVDGWLLASLAIDAAFFTRGSERIRVALPAG
ncbi:hypothetical protein [Sphingomonas sp. M1-B02]|uniref:hypothetical protein n=1 Tax=Sphingomonas sp. M1-B02 TaxID=3114300 RepID=UPI00223FC88F|nr:hypothetical protein [Sphingomonas sp. S6-11]UZK67474.1 hypothetical protein OKW87_06480 [Sphingomonas sp. S6-11]